MSNPAVATPSSMPGTPYEGGDATMLTEDEMTKDKCCTCRKPVDEDNSLVIVKASTKSSEVRRCRACHNVRSALNRLTSKHGNLVSDLFNKVDGDRLQAFYENHAHLRGDDLKSKVEEVVTDWKQSTTRVEFNTDGEYMDEVDLTEKYANKPDVLKNILMNAPRYFCPVKKCTLYSDPKYTSRVQDATENGTVEKRKGQVALKEDEEQGHKRPKTKKTGKDKDTEVDGEKKIKAGEKKKLVKKIDNVGAKGLQLQDMMKKCQELYGNMIPQYVLDNAKTASDSVAGVLGVAQTCVDTMKGDADGASSSLDDLLEKLTVAASRVKSQMDQAAAFK
eukprot:symbB.v1.2.006067.t1/scaffold332.1/size322744/2